jgi:hypothetical protein
MPMVTALASRVSELMGLGLSEVCAAANRLAHHVMLLKKQVQPQWEYNRVQDPTQKSGDNIEANKLVELLQEMFQSSSSWPTTE